MVAEKAKSYYAGKETGRRFNCAQSVIAAFSDKYGISEETIEEFKSYGAGRAPQGECGALYAVRHILGGIGRKDIEKCEDIFRINAGSTKCRQIRSINKLPCLGCVEKAAEFLSET